MKVFSTKNQISAYLQQCREAGKTVGFVPTMGALHQGHIMLLAQAQQQNDVVVCSIFVNPTQFTDPNDLEKYPRPIEADIQKLQQAGCDVLFNPPVTEMYAGHENWHLDLGQLEQLLEGEFRPGHYQGVTQVVFKLFDIVKPHQAFFGQKDYQQVLVIKRMIALLHLPVQLVMCPIKRETDGLAMSSRNIHLTPAERQHALILSQVLFKAKADFEEGKEPAAIQHQAIQAIKLEHGTQLEYFVLADSETLLPAQATSNGIVALVAARVGQTRLIDNVIIR